MKEYSDSVIESCHSMVKKLDLCSYGHFRYNFDKTLAILRNHLGEETSKCHRNYSK